jgi:prepilin-type N-terminal cleavage/methylation domain-containing protein
MSIIAASKAGFTLVEVVVAMAVFGFMLLIVVEGYINIARIHDQALASNQVQDSARTAMDAMVQSVRNSTGAVTPVFGGGASTSLCLSSSSTSDQDFFVSGKVLYQANTCTAPVPATSVALTNNSVQVSSFKATVETGGVGVTEPEVQMTITVASNNGSTNAGGTACTNTDAAREFCSVETLTSGAVPR